MPLELRAVKVRSRGLDPSSGTDAEVGFAEMVDPTTRISIWEESPPVVAVMDAVRLTPKGPPEKVIDTSPVESVVPDDALNWPLVAVKVIAWSASTELLEVNTVAVIVTVLDPSL
jgi:hypothetical protein